MIMKDEEERIWNGTIHTELRHYHLETYFMSPSDHKIPKSKLLCFIQRAGLCMG